jgi:transposase
MSLGKLDLPRCRWAELASILESRLLGQQSFLEDDSEMVALANHTLKHGEFVKRKRKQQADEESNADMQVVDLNSINTSLHRSLGAELVANGFWEKLGLDEILDRCGFNLKEKSLAKAVILGRLLHPDSELETWRWFQNNTALIEMTQANLENVGKDAFYEIGDLILRNKEQIEKELFYKEKMLFSLQRSVYLYDLTNTYLEGNANKNEKANLGHSKEKRTDCPLVALALVVDEMGFPVFSQIYKGNQGEPETLNDAITRLEKEGSAVIGDAKPVLIMDRGIATKDNITLIKEKGYPYTVISRQDNEKKYVDEISAMKEYIESRTDIIPPDWSPIDAEGSVYVKKVLYDDVCHVIAVSRRRIDKEESMDELKEKRFLEDIGRLKTSFMKGNICVPEKIGERIGRIKSKYPSSAKYYDIHLKISENNKFVTEINVNKKPERKVRMILTGSYVIETTQTALSGEEIWHQYMQLGRVESAFQDLKSELGLRPVYHQNALRTEAHLFIGVIAYHFLVSIENTLRANDDHREWKTIKKVLVSHQRSTTTLKGKDNKIYYIRTSGIPESSHAAIYKSLNVSDKLGRKKRCVLSRLW